MLMIIKIKIQLKYNNNLKPKIKIIKNYIYVLLGVYDIYVRLTTIELEFYCFFYKCTFVLHVTNNEGRWTRAPYPNATEERRAVK